MKQLLFSFLIAWLVHLMMCVSHLPTGLVRVACAQQGRSAALHGQIVDARTGEPMGKVRVIINGQNQEAITDDTGKFIFENLRPGQVELYITTVTYGLLKKTITLREGEEKDITIGLNEDAAALTEHVVVTSDPYETTQTTGVSEQTINKRELQTLSSILLGDPLRAAQVLPGAASNDDFRSEFSVRGAGFNRVGLYVDGVLTDNFVHTIAGEHLDTGSLSVINADTVDSISLMSGAFGSKFGERTAAILNIETRNGNRVKPTGRLAAALSGVSGIIDGPFASGRGSYLLAGRKSYVGYLIRRINDENHFTNNPPILNFADFQTKAIYDLTLRNQIGLSIIYGDFDFDRNRDRELLFINTVFRGNSRNLLVNAHWNFVPNSRVFLQTRFFGLRTDFHNINRDESVLNDGTRSQIGARSDLSFQLQTSNRVEAGLYVRSSHVDSFSQRFGFLNVPFDFGTFNRRGVIQDYYVQDTWSDERLGLVAVGGMRLEHSSLVHQTIVSPRGSILWSVSNNWRIRGAAGRYYQFADFEMMFGRLGNPALTAESSTQFNASVEGLFRNRIRVMAEIYDREDSDLFFNLSEPRLVNDVVTFAEFPFRNALKGHARGIELTLQRRSANKFTGWLSYAYSRTRLSDVHNGLVFVSNTDQRHTVNVYSNYRFTDTWNLSGQWRYGSGPPVPGFFRRSGQLFFLSNERNGVRVPYYSRVDVRVSKAFLFNKLKLTVNGEVLNLLNRKNVRYEGFDGFASDGRVFGQLNRVLPILPSAGVVIEF